MYNRKTTLPALKIDREVRTKMAPSQRATLSRKLSQVERVLLIVIVLGLLVSIYGLYVEVKHDRDQSYKPMCDISEKISCSAAFFTVYGRGLGLLPEMISYRNPVYAIIFYPIALLILGIGQSVLNGTLFLVLTFVPVVVAVYLAYILFIVLKVVCVVCISMYALSALLFFYALKRYNLIKKINCLTQFKKEQ